MDDIKSISYSEWVALISKVSNGGFDSDEGRELRKVFPQVLGKTYDSMIYNQLAKFEEYMLKESFRSFRSEMQCCLEELDLEMIGTTIIKLKKNIHNCMFFLQIPGYPDSVKTGIAGEVRRNLDSFFAIFSNDIKKLEYLENNVFVQDFVYICRKKLLNKKIFWGV